MGYAKGFSYLIRTKSFVIHQYVVITINIFSMVAVLGHPDILLPSRYSMTLRNSTTNIYPVKARSSFRNVETMSTGMALGSKPLFLQLIDNPSVRNIIHFQGNSQLVTSEEYFEKSDAKLPREKQRIY